MISLNPLRKLVIAGALIAAPAASFAGIFISVGFAPPALPVYAQPICPGDGYLWTPGYWAYAPSGYYWVPGVWVQPPTVGYLWTPPYWGFAGGVYGFHEGYWGPHIGFYGGINYGFGYGGVGYEGGYWQGGHLFYNRSVNNINVVNVHNVYVRNVTVVNNNYAHTSFNGGNGGVPARPGAQELQAERERHEAPTSMQQSHFQAAQQNRANFASANGGHPAIAAMQRPGMTQGAIPARGATPASRNGFGTANEVNTRQGNQQERVNQGIRSGQMTPGETRNVENRDASINRQANADRAANGGRLTGQERQQINQRQNNVSQSINNDRHNANTDAAAAARQGRAPQQERQESRGVEQRQAPHGNEAPRGGGEHQGGGHPPK
jgi:hypothetical protein